ncbi:hypothetical protein BH09ACT8_BH09ACT8_61080 [soil metagenome]
MNTGLRLSDLRAPSGKKARLQRIPCRHVLGDDTAIFLPSLQDKSRRYPTRRNQPR